MDKKRALKKKGSYDHLMGNPMDPANHPATSVPQATNPNWGTVLSPEASLNPNNIPEGQ